MSYEISERELSYYHQQSQISSPGKYEYLFQGLPENAGDLCQIIQKLLLHQFWIQDKKYYGVTADDLKKSGRDLNQEINLRTVEEILGFLLALDDCSLTIERSPEIRVVGNCRDYATLLVSILRHQGIPARVRSGVARYFFQTGFLEDHFICEMWNDAEKRWQQIDPQIDQIQKDALDINMDMTNLPPDQFLNAGESYYELQSGKVEPDKIGVMEFLGWKYVHYKLISDLASANKVEVLAWEGWGICERIMNEQLTASDLKLLGEIVEILTDLNSNPERFNQSREIFQSHPALQQPVDYQPYFMELPQFK
jgi:hypothetical protein